MLRNASPSAWVHTAPAQPHLRHFSPSSLKEFYRIGSADAFLPFSVCGSPSHTHLSLWAVSSPALFSQRLCRKLNLEKQSYSSQNPLRWLLLSLQVESPHVGGSSLTSLVHRTRVDTAAILLLCRNGPDEHHRHGQCQILQLCLCNDPSLRTRTGEEPP